MGRLDAVLKLIKRHYGEKMMHFCRDNFPTVLECPDKFYKALTNTFYPSKFIYDELMDQYNANRFIEIINDEINKKDEVKEEKEVIKTPEELLDEAGYILYECHTEKDIQSFRHYYKRRNGKQIREYVEGEEPTPYDGEELCTFNGDRLDKCHVFFAVKKNVEEIKREDFYGKEDRQDEYGTSVLSIQFTKKSNILSIKNRYNHTVANPDATFSNDLDNIIPGLTQAFAKKYGYISDNRRRGRDLPGFVIDKDGKYYKYNFETDGVYYCPNNIIVDTLQDYEVKHFDKSRYILFENFIIDLKDKELKIYYSIYEPDPFIKGFKYSRGTTKKLDSVKVETINKYKDKKITIDGDIEIIINSKGRIKHYKNSHIEEIGDHFLKHATEIESIDLPNVKTIKFAFLSSGSVISKVNLPNVERIGDSFLYSNRLLEELDLPKCTNIGNRFLYSNMKLKRISIPECLEVGGEFLRENKVLKEIEAPKLREINYDFLYSNTELKEIDLPEARKLGGSFIHKNEKLKKINLPKCLMIHGNFLLRNNALEEIDLPQVEKILDGFLRLNTTLKRISLPNCKDISDNFLENNTSLKEIDLPEVKEIGEYFLEKNVILERITLPKCRIIECGFLADNENLREIDLSSVEEIEYYETSKYNYADEDFKILPKNGKLIIKARYGKEYIRDYEEKEKPKVKKKRKEEN